MELYYLGKELVFPDVSSSISDVIAIGGDLSVERLLKAYQDGFFPWYSKGEPITWWSPTAILNDFFFVMILIFNKGINKKVFVKNDKKKTSQIMNF